MGAEKEQPDAAYVTTIICSKPVQVEKLGDMIKGLYRTLDSVIILGKSQMLILEDIFVQRQVKMDRNYEYFYELEFLAQSQKYEKLQKETETLIRKWGEEERPQIWIEGRIRQICYLLQRYEAISIDYRECEFLMDEFFANAESMEQLAMDISNIFFKNIREENAAQSEEAFFQTVQEYIQRHMAGSLSLQQISREVGVSQPYLSRLFRKYENTTFNSYLTARRMEKAKMLLQEQKKILVKEVAEQVGYKDQFYFSRIFYSYTGVRPSEYVEKEQAEAL